MTVTQIVNDLLENNMITTEAASVLLQAEIKANLFDKKNTNQVFQPYHGVPNDATSNPYYISTTTTDPIFEITTSGVSDGANELLKTK
jgi:hypothetical protein